jgi:hypothetical protein
VFVGKKGLRTNGTRYLIGTGKRDLVFVKVVSRDVIEIPVVQDRE